MNSSTLSKILLVQALEESDPHGHHLPLSTRHHATQQAREEHDPAFDHSTEGTLSFFTKRSNIMWAFVKKAFPAFAQSFNHLQVDIPSFLVVLPSLIAGLLINGLGESQRVNLLNFPLLILLLWNIGIYLFHRLDASTEILEDNVAGYGSNMAIKIVRKLGIPIVAHREPLRFLYGPLGSRSDETIHGTLVASRAIDMDGTPPQAPPPRSSLHGFRHCAGSVYPRVGA